MTAQAMDDDRKACLAAGMDAYISKPFQYHRVLATLQSLIQFPLHGSAPEAAVPVETTLVKTMTDQVFQYIRVTTNLADEQILKLVSIARRNLTELLAGSDKALQANDYTALGHCAHKLKGILLQCGLTDLADKAQEIHTRSKDPKDFLFADVLNEIRNGVSGLHEGP
jgi:CheY-like chemotaxis protein